MTDDYNNAGGLKVLSLLSCIIIPILLCYCTHSILYEYIEPDFALVSGLGYIDITVATVDT